MSSTHHPFPCVSGNVECTVTMLLRHQNNYLSLARNIHSKSNTMVIFVKNGMFQRAKIVTFKVPRALKLGLCRYLSGTTDTAPISPKSAMVTTVDVGETWSMNIPNFGSSLNAVKLLCRYYGNRRFQPEYRNGWSFGGWPLQLTVAMANGKWQFESLISAHDCKFCSQSSGVLYIYMKLVSIVKPIACKACTAEQKSDHIAGLLTTSLSSTGTSWVSTCNCFWYLSQISL